MSYELKPNTFSAFVNDKNGNDKRPDWTGKINIDGVEKRVAIWKRKSASGIEYLSGSIEETTQPDMPQPEKVEPQPAKDLLDDQQIPF